MTAQSTSNPAGTSLPPGFRFHPTDEELIVHYLRNKATSLPCPVSIIAEVDIYKFDPWDLPGKATFGEKEWYFFSPRDRKYPNGARPNRAAASGYWKATGTDKPILASGGKANESIGVKKALVFYKGRPPKGVKTNWIMHEYRLADSTISTPNRPIKLIKDSSMRLDDWVLCRIYKKSNPLPAATTLSDHREQDEASPFEEISQFTTSGPNFSFQTPNLQVQKSSSFSDLLAAADFSLLSHILLDNPISDPAASEFGQVPSAAFTGHMSNANQQLMTGNSNRNACSVQRLQPHSHPSLHPMQNELKRERFESGISGEEDALHPSKKLNGSCYSTNCTAQMDASQYHLLNQPLYTQQILLNSHLEF